MRTILLQPANPTFNGNVTIGGTLTVTGAIAANGGIVLGSSSSLAWSTDLFLVRDAANIAALRNGTAIQGFRVYNTFTDSSNYERINLITSSVASILNTQAAGTGTVRPLQLGIAGSVQWEIDAGTGNYRPVADNVRALGDATHRATVVHTYGVTLFEGANATQGVVTLSGAGSAIVYTTKLAAGSRIWLTHQNVGGTAGSVAVTTSVTAVSFTVTSNNAADTSVIAWRITGAS